MNDKLLLQDLVVLLAKKSGITQKDAGRFFRELFQLILERIYENDVVKIKDLGAFKLVEISSRESVDVNTGEKIEIPAHYKMAFTPDRSLRDMVNEPFAGFESVVLNDDGENGAEQEYGIQDFTGTIADNFKPAVDSFPDMDDELLLDNDDDDLLEMNTNSLEDESEDLLSETISFIPKKNREIENKPVIDAKTASETKPVQKPGNSAKDFISTVDKPEPADIKRKSNFIDPVEPEALPEINLQENKTAKDVPPLLDLISTKKDHPQPSPKVVPQKAAEDTPAEDVLLPSESDMRPDAATATVNQEDTLEQQDVQNQDDIEFNYIDYDKLAKESNKKKKILLYVIIAIIAAFAIYQFIKLFDVTYDYEYYINNVPPLTLSDSMRIVDEEVEPNPLHNANSDTALSSADKSISSAPAINPFTNERMESNLDELTHQAYTRDTLERKGIIISDKLQIKITNKAQIYLSEK